MWDEIKCFLNARYVSAPEAVWRLFEKRMHSKSHAIIRLPVHLVLLNRRKGMLCIELPRKTLCSPDGLN
ncbi:hypothetical protein X975_22709, partial [Stegodyphus mimosarum]